MQFVQQRTYFGFLHSFRLFERNPRISEWLSNVTSCRIMQQHGQTTQMNDKNNDNITIYISKFR